MNNTYLGKYVIAADGANSVIARQLGNDIRRGTAMAFMTIAHGNYPDDVCVIDMTRIKWGGYSWIFPRGGNGGEYDVGIGSIHWGGNYRTQLIKYVSDVGLREGGEIRGHPIPIKARDRIVSKHIPWSAMQPGLPTQPPARASFTQCTVVHWPH